MTKWYLLNLQLFAEGAEAGAEATGESVVTESTEATQTEPAAEVQERDFGKEFDALIKGDFKDEFQKRTQNIIDKRFKSAKETEAKLGKIAPILEGLSKRYGADANDIDGLYKAFTEDDVYIQHRAMVEDKSPEDVRKEIKTEAEREAERRELMQLRDAEQSRQQEEEIRERLRNWNAESDNIKSLFPSFDFASVVKNEPEVMKLATIFSTNGYANPLESAYRQVHNDELMTALASQAAKRAAKATADNIAAGANRPQENGVSTSVGNVGKINVDSLSENQIRDILKKVERGEKISF